MAAVTRELSPAMTQNTMSHAKIALINCRSVSELLAKLKENSVLSA
jgi:hypothetical protein